MRGDELSSEKRIKKALKFAGRGRDKEAVFELVDLVEAGDENAMFVSANVLIKNHLLYAAFELLNELVKNENFQARDHVVKATYEILIWRGDINAARALAQKEKRKDLLADLEARNFVRDSEQAFREVGKNFFALQKLDAAPDRRDFSKQLQAQKIKANIATIASQLHHTNQRLPEGGVFVSGDKFWGSSELGLGEQPEILWGDILHDVGWLVRDAINAKKYQSAEFLEALYLAQDARERLFFLRDNIEVSSDEDETSLSAIGYGLQLRKVRTFASSFYSSLLPMPE